MAVKGMRSEVTVVQHIGVADTVFAGSLAGMVGGALYASFAMGTSIMNGADILSPFRLTGAALMGTGALEGGTVVVVYGLLLHMVTSIVWGVLFAAILPHEASLAATLVAGLVYGIVVMLVMLYLVLPVANPVMREAVDGTTSFTIEHLIYGGSLSLVPMLRRRFAVHVE
jgi:uncharacterized membrane protein YagU involved in acid resistance